MSRASAVALPCARAAALVAVTVASARLAAADLADVRLSEIATAAASGDPAARYVELEATAAACVFPSTRVVSYDAAGAVVGDVAPFVTATCLAAGSYLLLATPAAQVAFATAADGSLVPPLDLDAGQVCLVSSATRYDCVRWGAITAPVRDLFGPDDASAAIPPPAGLALARVASTHVIAVDWRVETPTPRRPNDGTPWDPADAGVDAPRPDAGVDALTVDALRVDAPTDAAPIDTNQEFLGLDPRGGAACGCGTGATPAGGAPWLVLAALLLRRRARRAVGATAPPSPGTTRDHAP